MILIKGNQLPIICSSCGVIKEDYNALAKHILASKKRHQKGKPWAHKFLLKVRILDQKRDKSGPRTPLTDTQKENKKCCKTELSGKFKVVPTMCPYCKKVVSTEMPEEYITDVYAWKTDTGMLIVTCEDCR